MSDWSEDLVLQVWKKGQFLYHEDRIYGRHHRNPSVWRRDYLGNPIRFSDYGNTDSTFGWEIDHILRVKDGGSDELHNLRPLQWKANRNRG